ncbi:MAG: SMI1/KNR4 family protein [Clostridia bacterium]|nr:SMI1/KNR4 family protein [Clostridia bacterium]
MNDNYDNYLETIENENLLKSVNGAPDEEIQKIEKNMGVIFASDYREFLSKIGACIINGHEIVGICEFSDMCVENVTSIVRQQEKIIPAGLYVVENANIDGIVIWQDSTGTIYQTSPGKQPTRICDSLEEYIKK